MLFKNKNMWLRLHQVHFIILLIKIFLFLLIYFINLVVEMKIFVIHVILNMNRIHSNGMTLKESVRSDLLAALVARDVKMMSFVIIVKQDIN